MGAMDDAVENGVGQGGIANDFMPAIDRDLAGDQQRSSVVAIINDLEQIAALLGIERFRPPIVDNQQAGAFERAHQPRQPAFAARLGKIGEQARGALVEHRKALAACLVAESASQPRLADTGRADEAKMMMLADPLTARELEEESTVEAAVGVEVDVLDDGRLAQPGLAQAAGEPLVLAAGRFAIDEQPEPILAAEFAGVGSVLQLDKGIGHGGEAERPLTAKRPNGTDRDPLPCRPAGERILTKRVLRVSHFGQPLAARNLILLSHKIRDRVFSLADNRKM